MNYESFEAFPNILKSKTLIESIKHCKCIITLSEHLQIYAKKILQEHNYNIPIKILYHPADFNCKLFNYNLFNKNQEKKLVQIGFWMRKGTTIYNVQSKKFKKYWLPGGQYWKTMFSHIYSDFNNYLNDKSVIIKMYLSNQEYDNLLCKNIVLLDVFNSSANNTVLECIVRNTPLIVNNHPAIIEYLGENYPLYFNSIDDLNNIINDNNLNSKIKEAHLYLVSMNKEKFTIKYFCEAFNNILQELSKKETFLDNSYLAKSLEFSK